MSTGEPAALKPRYGRLAMFGTSVVVTLTAVLGGIGVLPSGGGPSYAATRTGEAGPAGSDGRAPAAMSLTAVEEHASGGATSSPVAQPATDVEGTDPDDLEVPADSGEGRRVVFSESAQRVWLVKGDGSVVRTYLVSGSVYDNLDPDTYQVYSRSKDAWGIDGSELHFMVRFTTGAEAAIGFHNIPVIDGEKVQTRDELGTPLSHGCIRQWRPDAKALWEFAQMGTQVVVVA